MFNRDGLKLTSQCMSVYIEENILQEISNYQKYGNFELESGGIIIGYYDSQENALKITDLTWPQENDICERFRFIRKEKGHQEQMDKLWEQSGYMKSYLGEWHTHNQSRPIPSFVDRSNWKVISKRSHNFDERFFIIIGKTYTGVWTVRDKKVQKMGEWDDNGII